MRQHTSEVATVERFEFGNNWANFLKVLNPERIAQAEQSLRDALEIKDLEGISFLDAGCGSSIFTVWPRVLAHASTPSISMRNRWPAPSS